MINLFALDPSTMALWYEPRWLRNHTNGEHILASVDAAIFGKPLPDQQPSSALLDVAYFTSAVWHEKRHYIDLLLTNYGWSRLWQFFAIYFNAVGVMDRIHKAG